ncbi:MAG: TetR/AcrR family transcriptional regulator [Hyphomonadaceae bacterium]
MSQRDAPTRVDTLETPESHRQTQAERRETAERAILQAAEKIVAERGLEELSMNEVGEAAGYSRALPGHYFGSKSALIQALTDHILAGYAERMRSGSTPSQGLDMLCDVVGFCIDDAIHNPVAVRAYQIILISGLTRPELAPMVDRMTKQSVEDIAGLIMLARETGDVRADVNALAEASIIISSIRGVLFQWLINPDHVSLSHMRACLLANVRTTLGA